MIEDFGGLPSEFSITAYTVGDAADIECLALVSALEAGGSGIMLMAADGYCYRLAGALAAQPRPRPHGLFRPRHFRNTRSVRGGYALGIGMIASAFAAGLSSAATALGKAF